jgi:hypothetical protein
MPKYRRDSRTQKKPITSPASPAASGPARKASHAGQPNRVIPTAAVYAPMP